MRIGVRAFYQREYPTIPTLNAAGFKLNFEIKSAISFRTLTLNPCPYPRFPNLSKNRHGADLEASLPIQNRHSQAIGMQSLAPLTNQNQTQIPHSRLLGKIGKDEDWGLGEWQDSTLITFERNWIPQKRYAGSLRIAQLICSGEATHATPQDLSTLLRWS